MNAELLKYIPVLICKRFFKSTRYSAPTSKFGTDYSPQMSYFANNNLYCAYHTIRATFLESLSSSTEASVFQHASGMLVARRIATKTASAEGREAHRDQKRLSFFAFAMRLGSCDTHSSNMFILRYGKVLVASIFQKLLF